MVHLQLDILEVHFIVLTNFPDSPSLNRQNLNYVATITISKTTKYIATEKKRAKNEKGKQASSVIQDDQQNVFNGKDQTNSSVHVINSVNFTEKHANN